MCCQLAEPSASSNCVSQLLSCSTKPAVHPRRSLFTPLRVPSSFSGTLIHRSSSSLLVARFAARARSRHTPFRLAAKRSPRRGSAHGHLSAPSPTSPHTQTSRCLAVTTGPSPPVTPIARGDQHETGSAPLCSCSGALFSSRDARRASAGESPIAQGTKNPSASAAVSGFIHKRSRLA